MRVVFTYGTAKQLVYARGDLKRSDPVKFNFKSCSANRTLSGVQALR